ncbi:Drug resistance MFS transporter, drug:H+ antiporter-2 (14 Spanner) (DHA2) family [Solimicrobium silvestre]|uniref:Drug resistance MFS transporter, drug:H+ antiporter-2 (14 Spanner) (DHA2) family n=2 Tax=Solimicrobium silvestre TaxID=2099400 RepID=A0A2S9H4M0_9BURK|nr:Drug resistance MFS transporter, drug:H+ antiporter-2 (14 Spanner) (DHA2) family [Solimicrobium silvestre]
MSNTTSLNASEGINPQVWKVAAVVIVGPFMTQMDSTVVNVSLSAIRMELHSSIATAQWIIGGYLLALALMLPLSGWLVDRIGAKRLYLGCFSVFTLASLLCGSARTMEELIGARLIQGIAGGLLAPMTQMMIARVAGKHMARVLGYLVVPIMIAPIIGPVLAGAILKYTSWPWLFYINLPIGVLGLLLASLLLPSDETSIQKRPFDLLGFLLISPGLACLLYGLQHASDSDGKLILLLGSVLTMAFIWHAKRKGSAALIDLELFHNRIFSTAAMTQFLSNGMFYARQFLIPLYLITGCALSPSKAGSMIAAMGLGMMCSFPLMGWLTGRFGCRAVSTGGALLALLGMLPFVWMIQYEFSSTLTVVSLFVAGAGHGMINIPSVSAAYASVSRDKLAVANTALNIAQRLGGPVATTVLAIVMSLAASIYPASGPHSFMTAFVLVIALHLLALVSASRLPISMHTPN